MTSELPTPGARLLLTIGLIVAAQFLTASQWPALLSLLVVALMLHAASGLAWTTCLKRLLLALPILVGITLAIPLGHGFTDGWELAGTILLRGLVALTALTWLTGSVPLNDLLRTLHRLRCPGVLISILLLLSRHAMTLYEEMARLQQAGRLRSGRRSGWLHDWRLSVRAIGMLLLRSFDRSDRISRAMMARHWNGEPVFLSDSNPKATPDPQRIPSA